jgi:hypothetical protein
MGSTGPCVGPRTSLEISHVTSKCSVSESAPKRGGTGRPEPTDRVLADDKVPRSRSPRDRRCGLRWNRARPLHLIHGGALSYRAPRCGGDRPRSWQFGQGAQCRGARADRISQRGPGLRRTVSVTCSSRPGRTGHRPVARSVRSSCQQRCDACNERRAALRHRPADTIPAVRLSASRSETKNNEAGQDHEQAGVDHQGLAGVIVAANPEDHARNCSAAKEQVVEADDERP